MRFSFFQKRKCKAILKQAIRLYHKKHNRLAPTQSSAYYSLIIKAQISLQNFDRNSTPQECFRLEKWMKHNLRKNTFDHFAETSSALIFALVVAVIVRQSWFEPYEIPSGSMRPTFKEQDRLVVSKTQFGLNFPLRADHLYFHPEQVKRGGIVVFTGENMDISDVKTRYFYIFPGHKQLIKRMIGLPGDTLYFYGGKIYGIDKDGHDISHHYHNHHFEKLEHIPFIHPEGKIVQGTDSSVFIRQMNRPIAEITRHRARILDNGIKKSTDLYDLWGSGNYATVRLLRHNQLPTSSPILSSECPPAPFYLELLHHINIQDAQLKEDLIGRLRPYMGHCTSFIPLDDEHIERLWNHLYTARFIVKNGYARRYGSELSVPTTYQNYLPKFVGDIPDGTYEFQNGQAYKVGWQGLTHPLPPTHPLTHMHPDNLYVLFNLGMEWDTRFLPHGAHDILRPARYTYFRDQELYIMGAPLFFRDDPTLQMFKQIEKEHVQNNSYYLPFQDEGAPYTPEGVIDKEKILQKGLKVPDHHYFVLGDNHAMSADSRDFGFLPESNIRGVPSLIFWGPGDRYGYPAQPFYSIFTYSRVFVWIFAGLAVIGWSLFSKRRYRLPSND